jgi:uncharacterized membrane protein YdjX (TVP38/TMEM64 family)
LRQDRTVSDAPPAPEARAPAPSPDRRIFRLLALAVVLGGAFLLVRQLGWFDADRAPALVAEVRGASSHPLAAPAFVLIYALATVLALPGSVLTLVGGAVFGFGYGVLLNWTGAMLGALGAYAVGRTLGYSAVASLLGARMRMVERAVQTHGLLALLRLRLIPLVPFNVLNYGAALTGVRAKDYALATGLGIIPGTVVYTYFADALVAGATEARRDAFVRLAIAGALLILLSFLPALARRLGLLPARSD